MPARHPLGVLLAPVVLVVAFTPATHAQRDIDRLRTRAEQGDPTAQFNLARLYATGTNVPQHDTAAEIDAEAEAARWYRLAAVQGHAGAQHSLGLKYDSGTGVPEDDIVHILRPAIYFYRAVREGDKGARVDAQKSSPGRPGTDGA